MPQRLYTVDQMCQDAAVFNSVNYRSILAVQGLNEGNIVSSGSGVSDIAADFIRNNIRGMAEGSWLQAMRDAMTYIKYGFALQNIVMERRTYGKYKGSLVLKKLAPRSQKSLYGWVWDSKYRELKGFVQKPMLLKMRESSLGKYRQNISLAEVSSGYYKQSEYPYFSKEEFLIYSYNATNNNPQGDLPAAGCFEAYVEKKVIEQYELSGVAKDLGGIIVARSPSDLFEKAEDPDNFPEAAVAKAEYESDIANMHNSDTTFVHLQSDRDDRGHYLYDFELKGVTGSGKSYSTTDIIKEKTKAIYNCFGTQSVLTGQDGVGSNALSKDQVTSFQYYVSRDMAEIADVINTQLLPRILAANDIYLDVEDMPKFVPLNPFKLSHDEAGKFVQRVKSVNALTEEVLRAIYDDLGVPTEGIDKIDYTDKGTSRSGESKGSSGTGDTQAGGSASESNMENGASADKSLKVEGDKIIAGDIVINKEQLNEDGEYK